MYTNNVNKDVKSLAPVLWVPFFMHHSSIPEKPLVVSANTRAVKPIKCFFFERPDGSIINVEEAEAWNILCGRIQVIGSGRQKFKYIGCSDGRTFHEGLMKAREILLTGGDVNESKKCIKEAEQKELEIARTNPTPPTNQDKYGDGRELI